MTKEKYWLTLLVFLVVPLSGVCVDIYVPGLPAVSDYFGVAKSLSQLTITSYLIGLGLVQLLAGSISDSFGRKRPVFLAMMIFVMSLFAIPNVYTIYQLIFLRFIQGAALAMVVVPLRAVIADLYHGTELKKMMTYLTMSWSLGPIVAPGLGGLLQYYFGWKSIFYFLGFYSVFMFLLMFKFLFETSQHFHGFSLMSTVKRYQTMLIHKEYMRFLITGGLVFSVIALFSVVSPFFIQTVLQYSAKEFGYITLLLGVAWFVGSMTNRFTLQVPLRTKAIYCFSAMMMVSVAMAIISWVIPISIYNIFLPMLCIFYCCGVLYPNYFMQTVFLFRENSASANALYNSSAFLIAGVTSGLGTYIKVNSELPFAMTLVGIILICIFISFFNFFSKEKSYARNTL
jgi:DHA1 family bicyclomycin/chloramphenicol resistance-like MFS transporter